MASKSKKNKVKFKFTKEFFFLIAALVILIAVTIVLVIPSSKEKQLSEINNDINTYNTDNSTSYYTLSKNNRIAVLSHNDLVNQKKSSEVTIVWYGVLSDGTYLEQISNLDNLATKYEVAKVYLYYATFVEDAVANEITDTLSYKNDLKAKEDELNEGKDQDAKDISLAKYPSIFVFKDGKLLYNSQVQGESSEYNYAIHFMKAFSYTDKAKAEEE